LDNPELFLDIDSQKVVINALSEKLRAYYVYPDIAEQIVVHLRNSLDKGEYSDISDGELFALALTMHMQEVNHDEHLWVRWHPESLPDFEGQLRLDQEWQEAQKLRASLDNFGVYQLERLPGNIGHMDIRYFHRATWGADTIRAAMSFVTDMNALIIDLRECTGGYPDMIALFSSYLFEGPPIHLNSIYWRDEEFTQEYWTRSDIPGRRFVGKSVYILVSKMTFSAGESFASILQTRQRARVIGEKTGGGAHPGASYRIHPHFEAFIPVGRAFDPLTGKDLEGIGVLPDICLPQEHAFLAAYHLALNGILEAVDGSLSEPSKALVEEARTAFTDLNIQHKFCPKCGYQNSQFISKCKNCDEPLPDKKC
jgi:hypothetical protein